MVVVAHAHSRQARKEGGCRNNRVLLSGSASYASSCCWTWSWVDGAELGPECIRDQRPEAERAAAAATVLLLQVSFILYI